MHYKCRQVKCHALQRNFFVFITCCLVFIYIDNETFPFRRYEGDTILFGGILEGNRYGVESRRNSGSVILHNVTLKGNSYAVRQYYGSSFSMELYDCILSTNTYVLYFRYSRASQPTILRRCILTENYKIIYYRYGYDRSITLDVKGCFPLTRFSHARVRT